MIGILQCGAAPTALRPAFGDYGAMCQRVLAPGQDSVIYDVTSGDLPPIDACTGYVLTGSPAGVYDKLPWIPPLLDFVRQAKGRARLVGICFGHQAMAQALGGEVIKSPKGWGIGVHRYAIPAPTPWMDGPAPIHVAASHQDQVVTLPPGARVVAESAFTPFAGLDYGDAISFQFHPEFDPAFGKALIETRGDNYGALAAPALASYTGPDDSGRVRGWIGRFLSGA